jgi:hypothetical protein
VVAVKDVLLALFLREDKAELLTGLTARFGRAPDHVVAAMEALDKPDRVTDLLLAAAKCESLAGWLRVLAGPDPAFDLPGRPRT